MSHLDEYLSGKKLWGDDFNFEDICAWYKDEEEGYSELGAKNKSTYKYAYHALNRRHAFGYLKKKSFDKALGIGSAYGDEFLPIIEKIRQIIILEPSNAFVNDNIYGVPCKYEKPLVDGKLPFENNYFDLITSFGVLHHIPNVTFVMKEIHRCLKKDGFFLIREPIVSMGDWSKPRKGGTKRERGIPINIFGEIISQAGFKVQNQAFCVFPPITRLCNCIKISAYNNSLVTWIDSLVCNIAKKKIIYHPVNVFQKFQPASVFFVLTK